LSFFVFEINLIRFTQSQFQDLRLIQVLLNIHPIFFCQIQKNVFRYHRIKEEVSISPYSPMEL